MSKLQQARLEWIFRIAVGAEFIGHGAFGIITKKAWVAYFGVVGISEPWAWKLMPLVGTVDILLGLSILFRPCRAALLYMTVWGFWTALLRPLSGEPVWETLERAGNYGVPLAFLLASQASGWFARLEIRPLEGFVIERLKVILRLTTATLLVGHGALSAITQKAALAHLLGSVGLSSLPLAAVGGFEIALGLAVLLNSSGALLIFILGWKVATEALYPISGAPFWEFVERGGSYAAPLLLFLLNRSPKLASTPSYSWSRAVPAP
jgi:hypothetical protein